MSALVQLPSAGLPSPNSSNAKMTELLECLKDALVLADSLSSLVGELSRVLEIEADKSSRLARDIEQSIQESLRIEALKADRPLLYLVRHNSLNHIHTN